MRVSASPTSASFCRFKISGGIFWSIARKQVQLSRPEILLPNASGEQSPIPQTILKGVLTFVPFITPKTNRESRTRRKTTPKLSL